MAEQKKYLSFEGLTHYDEKIKSHIDEKDTEILNQSKEYAVSLGNNYDPAGTAETKVSELANGQVKTNTDAIEAINNESTGILKQAKDYADGKDASIKEAKDTADTAQSKVDALETYVGTIPEASEATDVIGYIQEKTSGIATNTALEELTTRVANAEKDIDAIEKDYLTSNDKTELETDIKANTDAIAILNGEVTVEGSVAKQVADAVAGIVNGAPEAYDTLKEISDWIAGHPDSVAALNSAINANTTAIDALKSLVGTLPEGEVDVVSYIQKLVNAEETRAKGVEADLETRLKNVEAQLGTGEGSVEEKIALAKQEAIDTAATDATAKANQALTEAKAYTDVEIAKDRARLDALESVEYVEITTAQIDGLFA